FFFSSRRRHTRCSRDWSSDVCSSDLGAGIESELTRFFIATISVTQLIYMSEVGGLILGTKLPLKLWDLFIIFILRTLISIPIVEIGRASCRAGVRIADVGVSW